MERIKIKLTNEQWCDVVHELYLEGDEITEVTRNYISSGRHTEHHKLIFQRKSDSKFFKVNYETSVKDSMGWSECNIGTTEATEVFPEEKVITTYN